MRVEVVISNKGFTFGRLACRKVKYGHRETAETAAESMHKKTGDDYDAYRCESCDAWHIGHAR